MKTTYTVTAKGAKILQLPLGTIIKTELIPNSEYWIKFIDAVNCLINLRGLREQANYATGKFTPGKYKGGMKGCYTKGCVIYTKLSHALRGAELTNGINLEMMHNGEKPVVI